MIIFTALSLTCRMLCGPPLVHELQFKNQYSLSLFGLAMKKFDCTY